MKQIHTPQDASKVLNIPLTQENKGLKTAPIAKKKTKRAKRPGEGRPTAYRPEYCKQIVDYFTVDPYTVKNMGKRGKVLIANDLPFFSAFARKIGVVHDTLLEWKRVHPEFSVAFTRAKELQLEMLVSNGLNGTYESRFAIFAAKNMIGWVDKTEIEQTLDVIDRSETVPALMNRLKLLIGP